MKTPSNPGMAADKVLRYLGKMGITTEQAVVTLSLALISLTGSQAPQAVTSMIDAVGGPERIDEEQRKILEKAGLVQ